MKVMLICFCSNTSSWKSSDGSKLTKEYISATPLDLLIGGAGSIQCYDIWTHC